MIGQDKKEPLMTMAAAIGSLLLIAACNSNGGSSGYPGGDTTTGTSYSQADRNRHRQQLREQHRMGEPGPAERGLGLPERGRHQREQRHRRHGGQRGRRRQLTGTAAGPATEAAAGSA